MFPIDPGGGTVPSGVSQPDARTGDGDAAGGEIAGRVCVVLSDMRRPLSGCAGSGAGGLSVTLGTATATTMADGSFTIVRPAGTGLVWRVSGTGIEPAAMQVGATATIPAIDSLAYGEMLAATSATIVGGDGALIAQVLPATAGVTATSAAAESAIYYDGASATEWTQDATGDFGVVWIPSMLPGVRDVTIHTTAFTGIPIYANTITFAQLALP